jgi:hypothetical protein
MRTLPADPPGPGRVADGAGGCRVRTASLISRTAMVSM